LRVCHGRARSRTRIRRAPVLVLLLSGSAAVAGVGLTGLGALHVRREVAIVRVAPHSRGVAVRGRRELGPEG
jgi:hypothetical protein